MIRETVVRTVSRHPVLSVLITVVTALLLYVVFWYTVVVLVMIATWCFVAWYLARVIRRV